MSLSPTSPKELLEYALRLCAENNQRMGKIASADDARRAAEAIVASASVGATEPVGVSLLRQHQLSPGLHTPQRSVQRSAERQRPAAGSDSQAHTQRGAVFLQRQGPATRLAECPYCTEPHRRFCPESGRRHETATERSQRLWRTMFRYVQFSCRVACVDRLAKENTCSEEFYVEL